MEERAPDTNWKPDSVALLILDEIEFKRKVTTTDKYDHQISIIIGWFKCI